MDNGERRADEAWTYAEKVMGLPQTKGDAWMSLRHPSMLEGSSSYGTVAAPFLAGFAFTAVPLLISLDEPPPWNEAAIFLFVSATVAFLYALQFGAWMKAFVSAPSQRLDWKREASVDEGVFLSERRNHAADLRIAAAYLTRLSLTFDTGLLFFLAGITTVLVPEQWSAWRVAAVVPVGAAFVFEFYSIVRQWTRKALPDFWMPNHEAIAASIDLDDPGPTSRAAAGFGSRQPD